MKSIILAMLCLCLASCSPIEKIADFSDLGFKGEIWVKGLKHEKHGIVVRVNYKEQDKIEEKSFFISLDSIEAGRNILLKYSHELTLKTFLNSNFEPHAGILGGIAKYKIMSYAYSPDENRIAFIIRGEDGHAVFNPTLFVYDIVSGSIIKVDSTRNEMCLDVIWISDDEILYAIESSLCKATIK